MSDWTYMQAATTVWLSTRTFNLRELCTVRQVAISQNRVGIGAGSRNRTHDQRFTKPLLYQLSYAGA